MNVLKKKKEEEQSRKEEQNTSNKRKKHLNKMVKRCLPSEAEAVNQGSKDAETIQEAFNRLTNEFTLIDIGTAVKTGYVKDLIPNSPYLDFGVFRNGKRIAQADVTGSNYTLADSKIMPVRYYKGCKMRLIEKHLNEPCYQINWMKKEKGEVKGCCYWIKGQDVVRSPSKTIRTSHKPQDNFMTEKADWHKGLESLIEELRLLNK